MVKVINKTRKGEINIVQSNNDKKENKIEDMMLANGGVPDEYLGSDIILITVSKDQEKKLKRFIKKEEGLVFVFDNEPSMDNFRRLVSGSQEYLNSEDQLTNIGNMGKSTEKRIKYLKYLSDLSDFLKKEKVLSFVNRNRYEDITEQLELNNEENSLVLKDNEDQIEIEGFYYY